MHHDSPRVACAIIVALFACPVAAGTPEQGTGPFIAPNALGGAVLDEVRGGFAYGDNLLVTLGIDRVVRINGTVIEQSSVQFGDVGQLASGASHVPAGAFQGTRLIQNGQENQLAAGIASGALGGTVIQNTLNDQVISNQTTLRASVNSAGMVQAMNFSASLNQALNNAVAPK